MKEIEPRPYQTAAIKNFYSEVRQGKRRVMLCAPTGSGKLVMAIQLIKHVVENGRRVNFIVDRTVLVDQTSREFHAFGLRHGVEAGANTTRLAEPVIVRSAQTMRARDKSAEGANLNIVDEAHITHKHTAKLMMEGGTWLGLSASPFKAGLGDLFDSVINVSTTHALQAQGYLSDIRIFCGVPVEVSKKTSSGEYDAQEATDSACRIVGNIVSEWEAKTKEAFGGPVKTICFGNTVRDCMQIAESFAAAGYDFRAVSYLDDQDHKRQMIDALRNGDIMGLVSCEMLQRGFDVPDIMCGIDAHPWRKSLSSVVQQIGRAMRTSPGKEYALWLDHAQNCLRHRDRLMNFWSEGMDELEALDKEAGKDMPERKDAICPSCEAVMMARVCGNCGYEPPRRVAKPGEVGTMCVDGEMVALEHGDNRQHVAKVGRSEYELPAPRQGWEGLCNMAQRRYGEGNEGQAQRWCQANYRRLYGEFRKARFDAWRTYEPATQQLMFAVEHSKELYIAKKKRARKVA